MHKRETRNAGHDDDREDRQFIRKLLTARVRSMLRDPPVDELVRWTAGRLLSYARVT